MKFKKKKISFKNTNHNNSNVCTANRAFIFFSFLAWLLEKNYFHDHADQKLTTKIKQQQKALYKIVFNAFVDFHKQEKRSEFKKYQDMMLNLLYVNKFIVEKHCNISYYIA